MTCILIFHHMNSCVHFIGILRGHRATSLARCVREVLHVAGRSAADVRGDGGSCGRGRLQRHHQCLREGWRMAHGYWLAGGAGNFGSWLRYFWCNFNNFLQISVKSLMKLIGMYSLSKRMLVPQKNARNLWCTSQRHHLQRQHQCMQTVLAESIVFTCATGRCFGKTERLKDNSSALTSRDWIAAIRKSETIWNLCGSRIWMWI